MTKDKPKNSAPASKSKKDDSKEAPKAKAESKSKAVSMKEKEDKVTPSKSSKVPAEEALNQPELKVQPVKTVAPQSQPIKAEGKSNKSLIRIKQIGSPIRRDPRQKVYLKSLGLGKMHRVRDIVDTPSTRGLLDKLRHMVVIEKV